VERDGAQQPAWCPRRRGGGTDRGGGKRPSATYRRLKTPRRTDFPSTATTHASTETALVGLVYLYIPHVSPFPSELLRTVGRPLFYGGGPTLLVRYPCCWVCTPPFVGQQEWPRRGAHVQASTQPALLLVAACERACRRQSTVPSDGGGASVAELWWCCCRLFVSRSLYCHVSNGKDGRRGGGRGEEEGVIREGSLDRGMHLQHDRSCLSSGV